MNDDKSNSQNTQTCDIDDMIFAGEDWQASAR